MGREGAPHRGSSLYRAAACCLLALMMSGGCGEQQRTRNGATRVSRTNGGGDSAHGRRQTQRPDTGPTHLDPGRDPVAAANALPEPPSAGPAAAKPCAPTRPQDAPLLFTAPARPKAGERVHVVAVSRTALENPAVLVTNDGGAQEVSRGRFLAGPPWVQVASFTPATNGRYAVQVQSANEPQARCTQVVVGDESPVRGEVPQSMAGGAWPIQHEWTPEWDLLYSAWIGVLFYVDPGARASWRPLHQTTRDPSRNFLYNFLGLDEDDADAQTRIVMRPDCADTPFQLRAYFAFKMGLPFGFRRCSRGSNLEGPYCTLFKHNQTRRFPQTVNPIQRFNVFVRDDIETLVQAGTTRTLPTDTWSDLYSIELTRENIRPGAVYVDPDGHVLTISQWVPQTEARMGMINAVDGHPDQSISHKRFNRALFSFYHQVPTGGFKHFRPAIVDGDRIRPMTNAELQARGFAPVSSQQASFERDQDFYRTVNRLVNPQPMDPVVAYRGIIEILHQYALDRVDAVQLGVEFMQQNNWRVVQMPSDARIFETIGDWEDYSTPARDMRFLVAMDEVEEFPDMVRREPELFQMRGRRFEEVRQELLRLKRQMTESMSITYRGSDGTNRTLTLAELMRRKQGFEVSYNPNDCIEVRWAESSSSAAMQACTRRHPENQRPLMNRFRGWFAERRRPAIR